MDISNSQLKTDLFIISITGIFNWTIGFLLLFIGIYYLENVWYKLVHILQLHNLHF